jgi:hypothetical protein
MTRYCVAKGSGAKSAFLKAVSENPFLASYKAYMLENVHRTYSFEEAVQNIDHFVGALRGHACRALLLGDDTYFFFVDPAERDLDGLLGCVHHLKDVGTPLTPRIVKGLRAALKANLSAREARSVIRSFGQIPNSTKHQKVREHTMNVSVTLKPQPLTAFLYTGSNISELEAALPKIFVSETVGVDGARTAILETEAKGPLHLQKDTWVILEESMEEIYGTCSNSAFNEIYQRA